MTRPPTPDTVLATVRQLGPLLAARNGNSIFHAAIDRFCNGTSTSMTVESVTETELEEDDSGHFDTGHESGSSFVAATEVQFSAQQGGPANNQIAPRILTIYLNVEDEQYRVLDLQELHSLRSILPEMEPCFSLPDSQ